MISVDQLAQMSGLAVQTLYNKINRQRRGEDVGRFPRPVRLGRRLRFRAADVERWLSEGDGPTRNDESSIRGPSNPG